MIDKWVWLAFLGAAALEVGGDAVVRRGLTSSRSLLIGIGCLMLAMYGVLVNSIRWDFSKIFGIYVAVFALVGVLTGRFIFKETVPASTWIGLGIMLMGAMVIQWGTK